MIWKRPKGHDGFEGPQEAAVPQRKVVMVKYVDTA